MSNQSDGGASSKHNSNELDQVIRKIILYSRNDVSPSKFLKYLNILSKCSTNVPGVESQLRRRGALEAIILALKHLKLQECEEERDKKYSPVEIEGKDRQVTRKIYNEGLRVLSNAFVVDYKSRREAIRANFVPFLQKVILNNPNDNVNLARSIKCLVNLSKDQECLLLVRKNYIYQSILSLLSKILSNVKEKTENTQFSDEDLPLISALIRAIRIFSSDEILKTILLRENAVMLLGEIFVVQEYNTAMKSEFLRSFEALTDKVRSFPKEMIFQLTGTESGKKILKSIIDNIGSFERIPIDCLHNLSNSGSISRALGFCGIFPILLEYIEKLMAKNEFVALGRHLSLVSKLSKSAKENQLHLSNCSQKILLDILKSPNCREFQLMVLSLFEDYYESAFNSLLSFGFVDILFRILVEEGGKCSYEEISKRLQNFDDQKDEDKCPAHVKCIFKPTYRCNSPTYHAVKKSMEEYLRRREEEGNIKRKSETNVRMSPESKRVCYFPSSPSSSISSYSARCSSADGSDEEEGTISPFEDEDSSSPGSSWNLLDETSDPPLHFSEEEELSISSGFQEMSPDIQKEEEENDNEPTSTVKRNRESTEDSKEFSPPPFSPERESQTNYSSSYSSSSSFTTTLKGKKVPESFEKISSILKTFSKAIHFTSFPLKSLIELTPYLLSILINGKLNHEAETFYSAEGNPEPVKQIGMKIFSYSWSILKFLTLKIDIQEYLLKTKIINLLFKIFYPYEETDEFYKKYGECLLENLWGVSDISNYYREAQFDSILRLCPNSKTEIALTIPLFFFRRLKNCRLINKALSSIAKFESFYSLTKKEIHLILSRDELEFESFQECILALIAIAGIFSATWTESDEFKKRRLLFKPTEVELEEGESDSEKVKFVLDDGSEVLGNKSIITSQCPVFSAMFEGHFTESREQKVTFRDTSKKTLTQFLHQISQLKDRTKEDVEEIEKDSLLDLDTIFGIISLSNMFMLEEVFIRGMNSIVAFYLCPHSAASIFERAIQLEAFEKPGWWKSELNLIAIKYLLVGPGISLTARISAFWQIFDLVENHELVATHLIKTIDFFHEFKSKSSLAKY